MRQPMLLVSALSFGPPGHHYSYNIIAIFKNLWGYVFEVGF